MPTASSNASSPSFKAIERTYELARIRLNKISQLPNNAPRKKEMYDDAWEEAELARATWSDALVKTFEGNDHRVGEITEQLKRKVAAIEDLLAQAQRQAEAFAMISSAIALATQLVRVATLLG